MEDCPSGHLGRDALALQRHPYSLEEFAGHSTLHGMRHIFRYRRFTTRNLLWLLAFLGSLALLIHSYAKCVSFYFQYPHNTQLEEETTRNKTFPAVTLCNLNPARYSQLSAHDLYWAGEMLGLLDGAGQPLVRESMERSRLEALLGTLVRNEKEKSHPFNLDEFYSRVGHQLDMGQMLVRCTFSGEECNSSDFQTLQVPCLKQAGIIPPTAPCILYLPACLRIVYHLLLAGNLHGPKSCLITPNMALTLPKMRGN
ncbi:hypothetical protein Q9966_008069 [Columba livia]|nr:hypothetical protein Q9966_008069 [Columba livia]